MVWVDRIHWWSLLQLSDPDFPYMRSDGGTGTGVYPAPDVIDIFSRPIDWVPTWAGQRMAGRDWEGSVIKRKLLKILFCFYCMKIGWKMFAK